jgi:predicted transcriptional regulator
MVFLQREQGGFWETNEATCSNRRRVIKQTELRYRQMTGLRKSKVSEEKKCIESLKGVSKRNITSA